MSERELVIRNSERSVCERTRYDDWEIEGTDIILDHIIKTVNTYNGANNYTNFTCGVRSIKDNKELYAIGATTFEGLIEKAKECMSSSIHKMILTSRVALNENHLQYKDVEDIDGCEVIMLMGFEWNIEELKPIEE